MAPEREARPGAADDAITAREREIDRVLSSLGPAEAPPDLVANVVARISPYANTAAAQPVVHQFVPKRGVTVNKKLIYALAAAAVVVLAVITYTSYPPATTGTEATIGAAQRAQQPQIAAKDVGLGDQSAQDVLQSDTWDAIMKDEDMRSTLQDAEVRKMLEDAELRKALENEAVRRGLTEPEARATLKLLASARGRALTEAEARNIKSAQARAALQNEAFANALRRNPGLAARLLDARVNRAFASDAMARALRDRGFEAALRNPGRLDAALRSGAARY